MLPVYQFYPIILQMKGHMIPPSYLFNVGGGASLVQGTASIHSVQVRNMMKHKHWGDIYVNRERNKTSDSTNSVKTYKSTENWTHWMFEKLFFYTNVSEHTYFVVRRWVVQGQQWSPPTKSHSGNATTQLWEFSPLIMEMQLSLYGLTSQPNILVEMMLKSYMINFKYLNIFWPVIFFSCNFRPLYF